MRKVDGTTYYESIQNGTTVTIGGKTTGKFVPNLNFSKWNDEYFWNINLPVNVTNQVESFDNGRISITVGGLAHVFYELTGDEIEYEIILYQEPPRNYYDFNITCRSGVRFFHQLDLTRQWEIVSQHRSVTLEEYLATHQMPDRAIDSIAIYCDKANGKYQTGKIGHIYRPHLTDALGGESWGSWELRDGDTVLRLSADATWLANATYPVTIDPTFGNTNYGAASEGFLADSAGFVAVTSGLSSSGSGDSITIRASAYTSSTSFKGMIVDHDAVDTLITNGVGDAAACTFETEGWYTSTFATAPTLSAGTMYFPGMIVNQSNFYVHADYTGSTYPDDWYGRKDTTNSYTTPTSPGILSLSEYRLSIYCTYTEGLSINQSAFRFRNDDGDEDAATWKAAENENVYIANGATTGFRLRFTLDATSDPASKDYKLEYRYKPSGGSYDSWRKVPIGE